MLSKKNFQSMPQNILAIAAIFRDEARYLKEWIEFHRKVGVEHFYLLNNLSQDAFLSVLEPYIQKGLVELFNWPFEHENLIQWNKIQVLGYQHILQKALGKTQWLAFLDVDEFLFPVQTACLKQFLKNYSECVGIGVNWQVFGSSGVTQLRRDDLLIERLTFKLPKTHPMHLHIKSIVRPEYVSACINPHFMLYANNKMHVNSDKVAFDGAFSPYVQINQVRINHYVLRDECFYQNIKLPRRKKWFPETTEFENWYYNQVQDETILRCFRAYG